MSQLSSLKRTGQPETLGFRLAMNPVQFTVKVPL